MTKTQRVPQANIVGRAQGWNQKRIDLILLLWLPSFYIPFLKNKTLPAVEGDIMGLAEEASFYSVSPMHTPTTSSQLRDKVGLRWSDVISEM